MADPKRLSECPGCDTHVYSCRPHVWLGGRPCPWCLLDATRERLRAAERVVEAFRSESALVPDHGPPCAPKDCALCRVRQVLAAYDKLSRKGE